MGFRMLVAACAAVSLAPSCTVMRVDADDQPPRIESRGLIDGHVALGIRDEDEVLRLRALDGDSPGSILEFSLWRLLRLEVGLLGAGLGVGPVDLALGVAFYDPRVPTFVNGEKRDPSWDADDCPECRAAREAAEQ
jgi:hypothetical protein